MREYRIFPPPNQSRTAAAIPKSFVAMAKLTVQGPPSGTTDFLFPKQMVA
jgi:hypothetical protein